MYIEYSEIVVLFHVSQLRILSVHLCVEGKAKCDVRAFKAADPMIAPVLLLIDPVLKCGYTFPVYSNLPRGSPASPVSG